MRNLLYIAAILIVGCSKPTMDDAFIAPPIDVTTPTETTTATTDNGNNTDTDTDTSEQTIDASQYMVIAEGEGSVEVLDTITINGNLSVTVRVTPDAGYTIWDFQGADLNENQYDLIFNVTGAQEISLNFKGQDDEPANAYLTADQIWVPTEGHPNSLEWHEGGGYSEARNALNRAYEIGNDYMDEVLSTARILWFPETQELPNGESQTRVANTAGGTSCSHDDRQHLIDMRHGGNAGILFHEAGHTVDNNCSVTNEQHERSSAIHGVYLQELINNGGNPSDHYQLGFGAGEWFACATSAYFDVTGQADLDYGAGSIKNGYTTGREGLEAKYPEMFNLMQEIYN